MSDTDLKIEDLQMRIAFQEDNIDALNSRVVEQQAEIDKLHIQLQHINKKLKALELTSGSEINNDNVLPPHY